MREFQDKNLYFDRLFHAPDLKWLGQNTNHTPMHPAVRAAMVAAIDDESFHAYAPPAGFEELRAGIVEDLGIAEAEALVTEGAVNALFLVCRAFCRSGSNFVTTDPGWKWPMQFARQAGAEVREIPIYDALNHYKLTSEQLASTVDSNTSIVYLVDPNNPLGVCYSADELRQFTEIARRAGAAFIHDCTYRQFADDHQLAARFYPERTITTYSFSKWLGLAGLRVGAAVSSLDVIEELARLSPATLGASVIAQRAALAGLQVKTEWMETVQSLQRRNQAAIHDTVAQIPGLDIPVYPSQGNFLVVECVKAGVRPEALVDVCREHGIMIRQGTYHTPRFGDRFIKVSTSVPADWVDAFCNVLPRAVEVARGRNDVSSQF